MTGVQRPEAGRIPLHRRAIDFEVFGTVLAEDAPEFEGKAKRRGRSRFEQPVTDEQRSFSLEKPADSPLRCEISGLARLLVAVAEHQL